MTYFWYKAESSFGPGHQGHETRYFYSRTRLSELEIDDYEREEAYRISCQYDADTISRIVAVDSIPEDEIECLRKDAELQIRIGNAMIKALDKLGN